MKKLIFALSIFIFLLFGCLTPKVTNAPTTPQTLVAPLPSMTPSPMSTVYLTEAVALSTQPGLTPTSTPQRAPEKTGTITPTIHPEILSYQCLEIAESLPPDSSSSGVIILYNLEHPAYFWNAETRVSMPFPQEVSGAQGAFQVSPKQNFVLYQTSSEFAIATSDGNSVWSQTSTPLSYLLTWFDNEHLLFFEPQAEGRPSLSLLNPFTGERRELPSTLPDISDTYPRWKLTDIVFDPSLTRAVYPLEHGTEQSWPVILWDLELYRELTRLVTVDSPVYGYTPIWLPNGEALIIAASTYQERPDDPNTHNEFYRISKDGQIQQITHFTDLFKNADIYHGYSLSPDSHYIAFWLKARPSISSDAQLMILDLETGKVTGFCIAGVPFLDQSPLDVRAPIWSPDSTQLLILSSDPEDYTHKFVVLVDIVNGFAGKIADYTEAQGWMVAP